MAWSEQQSVGLSVGGLAQGKGKVLKNKARWPSGAPPHQPAWGICEAEGPQNPYCPSRSRFSGQLVSNVQERMDSYEMQVIQLENKGNFM